MAIRRVVTAAGLLAFLAISLPARAQDESPPKEETQPEKTPPAKTGDVEVKLFVPEGEEAAIPIIVTATAVPVHLDESGNAVTVIGGEHIEAKNAVMMEQTLREIPGLAFGAQGLLGSRPRNVFLRGGESDHTLVLIDGHKVNALGGGFDWSSMMAENVERVEVWRGAGSALYGSDAVTGVINIITKKGRGPAEMVASVEGGNQRFSRVRLSLSGGSDQARYSVSLSRVDMTDPDFDSAFGSAGFNNDYHNTTFTSGVTLTPSERTRVDFTFHQVEDESGFSTNFYGAFIDPNDTSTNDQALIGVTVTQQIVEDVETVFRFTRFDQERRFIFRDDATDVITGTADTAIQRSQLRIQTNYSTVRREIRNVVSVGFDFEFELQSDSVSEQDRSNSAYFVQDRFEFGHGTRVDVGLRLEDNEQYGESLNYRFAISQKLGSLPTRLRASVGTGIKEPEFTQIADTSFSDGNPDLDPEQNFSVDFGVSHRFEAIHTDVSATVFLNKFTDFIQFVPSNPLFVPDTIPDYVNAGEAQTQGLELEIVSRPHPMISLRAALTVMDTDVTDDNGNPSIAFAEGKPLVRRPDHTFTLSANVRPIEAVTVQATLNIVGERDDLFFGPPTFGTRVVNPAYTRVDLSASWQVLKRLRVFGRIQNLFDDDYQEIAGFQSPGISAFAGIEYRQTF